MQRIGLGRCCDVIVGVMKELERMEETENASQTLRGRVAPQLEVKRSEVTIIIQTEVQLDPQTHNILTRNNVQYGSIKQILDENTVTYTTFWIGRLGGPEMFRTAAVFL